VTGTIGKILGTKRGLRAIWLVQLSNTASSSYRPTAITASPPTSNGREPPFYRFEIQTFDFVGFQAIESNQILINGFQKKKNTRHRLLTYRLPPYRPASLARVAAAGPTLRSARALSLPFPPPAPLGHRRSRTRSHGNLPVPHRPRTAAPAAAPPVTDRTQQPRAYPTAPRFPPGPSPSATRACPHVAPRVRERTLCAGNLVADPALPLPPPRPVRARPDAPTPLSPYSPQLTSGPGRGQ